MRVHASRIVAALLLITSLVSSFLSAQEISDAEWQEDLDFLLEKLETKHPDAWKRTPKAEWMEDYNELYYQVPMLRDDQVAARLMKLVASLNDGHTRTLFIDSKIDFEKLYPVRLYLFTDGLHIVTTTPEHADILGARVLAFDGTPAAEAVETAGNYYSWDNEFSRMDKAPLMLINAGLMHAIGIANAADGIELQVETADGQQQTVTLDTSEDINWDWNTWPWRSLTWGFQSKDVEYRSVARQGTPPLAWRNMSSHYWYEFLPEHNTVYMQYNSVTPTNSETEQSWDAFLDELFAEIDARNPDKLIIDMRWNTGGSGGLTHPLIKRIIRREEIDQTGKLYVIFGRRTFSAAIIGTGAFETWTNALFVGEPTGSTPNQFGDAPHFDLPHSGINVSISSVWWMNTSALERRPYIPPHISAQPSFADFAAGRDPVVERILEIDVYKTFRQRINEAQQAGGAEAVEQAYRAYHQEFANPWRTTQEEALLATRDIFRREDVAAAERLLTLNLETYPDHAWGYFVLAQLKELTDKPEEALALYEKTLEILPDMRLAQKAYDSLKEKLSEN